MKKQLLSLALSGAALACCAQTSDLCLPSALYVMRGVTDTLWAQAAQSLYGRSQAVVRWSGSCAFTERRPQRAVIASAKEGDTLRADLVSTVSFDTLRSCRTVLHVADTTGSGTVSVQILGDSYVQGAFFRDALISRRMVPGLRMIGLRRVEGTDDQYDEGRGGWTVQRYFEVRHDSLASHSPIMQPPGEQRYWGATAFWQNAHRAQEATAPFETRYACGRFTACLPRFSETTGLLLKPRRGDMMWDSKASRYVIYNGRRWKPTTTDESLWAVDYGKYLAMWGLERPQILMETLGLNDYRDSLTADYTLWNSRLEALRRSYQEAVPGGVFVVVVPCSSCGSMDNRRGDFTLRQDAAMWLLRRNIMQHFDGRERSQVYVLDMGLHIGSETGYRRDRDGLQTGNPHPYVAYPAMSVGVAAFVQYIRNN